MRLRPAWSPGRPRLVTWADIVTSGRCWSLTIGLRRPGDGLAESTCALRPLVGKGMGNCPLRRLIDKKDRLRIFQSVRMFDIIDIAYPGSGHGR